MSRGRPRVVVVGAGVSGLAAAHFLRRAEDPPDVLVVEASERAGGKVHTIAVGGLPVEAGADSFVVRKPWAVDLCRDLGLEDRVVIPGAWGASVLVGGRLFEFPDRTAFGIPADLGDLLRFPGLGRRAKLRAALDLVRPPRRSGGDESVASLLRRRLGSGFSRVAVEPLLAGLHAGRADGLSVRATFPELAAWERDHGSLRRAARASVRAAGEERGRQPMFAALWGGLESLVRALVESVGPDRVLLDRPVSAISAAGSGFAIAAGPDRLECDVLVLATPAFESARLLSSLRPAAAAELEAIPYASTAVVALVYPEASGSAPRDVGTGFVVPPGDGVVTACTLVSRKWPHEAYGDRAVLRCFVGRAGAEEAVELPDDELVRTVRSEVEPPLGLDRAPEHIRVVRWRRAMPQYELGHLERVSRIEDALEEEPGIVLVGAAHRGVGIADCVRGAREGADRALAHLEGRGLRHRREEGATTWTR